MVARERVSLEPGYVLHHREYRDTSRILDVFSARHGRLTLFARGARGGFQDRGDAEQPLPQHARFRRSRMTL